MGTAHSTSSHPSNHNLTLLETMCPQGPLWVTEDGDGIVVVGAETNAGLVQGSLPSATLDEVVFPAAASGQGLHSARGRWAMSGGTSAAAVVVAELGGALSRLCWGWGDGRSPTRHWLQLSRPQPRDPVWGAGGRGQSEAPQGQGLGGSSAGPREDPPPQKLALLSPPPAADGGVGIEVRGRCPSPAPPRTGSGLTVALIDVVFHQSHHLLELVLQLGPPGRGVCLQGGHNLKGKQGAAGSQPKALGPRSPHLSGGTNHTLPGFPLPATSTWRTSVPGCEYLSRNLSWGFPEQSGGRQGSSGEGGGPMTPGPPGVPTCVRYLLAYL